MIGAIVLTLSTKRRQAPGHRRAGGAHPGKRVEVRRSPARRHLRGARDDHRVSRNYLTLAAIVFTIGMAGIILNHKNIIIILMSVELILLSVNINLVAFSTFRAT